MRNSQNMSLEDRIVQVLKEDKLMSLVGDEDAIRKLVERALREALFEERTIPGGNQYHPKKEPSAVVSAAREAAAKIATEMAEELIVEILEHPDMKKTITEVMPGLIVRALMNKAEVVWDQYRDQVVMEAQNRIMTTLGAIR